MRIKASAKLTLLHSMLKILHKEGHRVLVFSQMTKLLDILEDYLTFEFGPKTFERVDGSVSVSDRQIAIARFNQDRNRFVFLLSTRSCGLGINLATADTVIIYDSDFNPHADIQAMNRAHRIGQSNRLLVYRLVVRASVEERILQLARKKLMLDQLFVNKSETQKEVEDILRWGTEELFRDGDGANPKEHNGASCNKSEAVVEVEQRHRKRAGGLGDVYQDRCAEVSTKVMWDDSAILKLLDRSNLQAGPDVDVENDMLGSVKALEWNDEQNEEHEGTDSSPTKVFDGDTQVSESKDDNTHNGMEENEWDRLLRFRWEKYQSEEEAVLGRGKRLRKAVSYRETFASLPTEALCESGNEEESMAEYTPAGKAHKEKYAKLRARQKERLAHRHMMEKISPPDFPIGDELLHRTPSGEVAIDTSRPLEDKTTIHEEDGSKQILLPQNLINRSISISKQGKHKKHGHKRLQHLPLDLSVTLTDSLPPDSFLPSHQTHAPSSVTSLPASNELPVLGLCAPNASQIDTVKRNIHSSLGMSLSSCEHKATNIGMPEFPFPSGPGSSSDMNQRGSESTTNEYQFPGLPAALFHGNLKNIIPGSYFPFNPHPHASSRGGGPLNTLDHSCSENSAFKEKMEFPNFASDENPLSKFPLPSMNVSSSFSDVFSGISKDLKAEPRQDFLKIPLVPNFKHLNDSLKQKQQVKDSHMLLGLGQVQFPNSLSENHKKVLDNIIMRTGYGTHKSAKKKQKSDSWSEDELDALWIGVRRHGRGNWNTMLGDSKLKFSRHKTPEDLSMRWYEEQEKLLTGPMFQAPKSSKTIPFPDVFEGTMSRALSESKFIGVGMHQSKSRSHLTDIKLGCGRLSTGMPSLELTDHFKSTGASSLPFPPYMPGKVPPNISGDFGAGPSEIMAKLGLPSNFPFQQNQLPISASTSPSMNYSNFPSTVLYEGKLNTTKFPYPLDRSLTNLHNFQLDVASAELDGRFPDHNKRVISSQTTPKHDDDLGHHKINNLPHWLREAVSIPASRPPEPCLPPSILAIAHSVRLVYGEEIPLKIPEFTMPKPLPIEPEDPRKMLKRKRKLHDKWKENRDIGSSKKFASTASGPSSPDLPVSVTGFLPAEYKEASGSSLNLNLTCPSSIPTIDEGKEISPFPEALEFVACSATPGPTEAIEKIIEKDRCCELEGLDAIDKGIEVGKYFDTKVPKTSKPSGSENHRCERTTESGDSSKICSHTEKSDQIEDMEVSSGESLPASHERKIES